MVLRYSMFLTYLLLVRISYTISLSFCLRVDLYLAIRASYSASGEEDLGLEED